MIPNHDTDWALSAKGNWWRRANGVPLIVGKSKHGRIWARVGDDFLEGNYDSIVKAQAACEKEARK
jgi:hypothetical protein